jgi:NCAIR mutase (PurE)-related protein
MAPSPEPALNRKSIPATFINIMDKTALTHILTRLQNGNASLQETLNALHGFPAEVIEDAVVDHQRGVRTGIPEVIFGENKSGDQIVAIARALLAKPGPVLATRVDREKAAYVINEIPALHYHAQAAMLSANETAIDRDQIRGDIVLICAGTSDIAVAEEAHVTARALGHPVTQLYDVGVAGLHRLLNRLDILTGATVIIVVAGMEGALPSVVGGLVNCPVIGVPTSVGYGTGAGGFAALLGMLNSCAPGVAVVNIDNGFGAGCLAASINRCMKRDD